MVRICKEHTHPNPTFLQISVKTMSYFNSLSSLILFFGLSFGAAALGGYFTSWNVHGWYQNELLKPAWTPSGASISAIWTSLFTAMAFSAWLVARNRTINEIRIPMAVFIGQLFFNVLWSFLFFGVKRPGLALIELFLLLFAIGATIKVFVPYSKWAAFLLIPYFCWVLFAGLLNFQIWRLNL